jgi:hypothetical protein
MGNKKNIQNMTSEELAAYVEVVRQRNRANAKKYYDQKIKMILKNTPNSWKSVKRQISNITTQSR